MSAFKKVLPRDIFANEIRRQIQDGLLAPDNYLLPERELAKKYSVSLRVVREGLACLVAEGWIRRHQGKGTIIQRRAVPRQPQTPKNVAVVIQGRIRDTSTADFFDALQQGFQARGFGTTLYVTDASSQKETEIFYQLVRDRVPGAVLFSSHPSTSFAHLQHARAAGMKIVVVDHDFPGFECDSVAIDDQLGGYEATAHLIQLGCAELVHVTYKQDWTSCALRRKGFEMAVSRFGKTRHASVVALDMCSHAEELNQRIRNDFLPVLQSAKRPLGVLAGNDTIGVQVMALAREAGFSVPKDVAVVGFDNDMEGAIAEVPLTTVEIPREEIAGNAVQMLMERLSGERHEPKRIRLKPRLILRKSCGCYAEWENATAGEEESYIRRKRRETR